MSRIEKRFSALKEQGRKGLIIYVNSGYPDYEITYEAVLAMAAAGADVIELGLPFSDPMADGPVIQKAATEALAKGATTAKALDLAKRIRQQSDVPLAVMTYVNTILNQGVEKFVQDFAAAGIDGLIAPDVPAEEAALLQGPCQSAGMDLISFVAPTTDAARLPGLCRQASGFIYCIATTGVTGVRQTDYSAIGKVIQSVRSQTKLPLAIGFGIGSPEAAVAAAQHADAVIVGSAVVKLLAQEGVDAAAAFVASVRQALDEGRC
ncbi:MAG: tryptophan synthase subunit alpha [Sporomusaceae bacterium]|nr:tryptophan synthase subunit alpha [Sporomusaceae bacterium]